MELRRKEGESVTSFIYRFTKRVKQSGILKEAKKRRFRARPMNRNRRRLSALHRETKKVERQRLKKLGLL
ncbi:MAG: 30S ribosomal protein S21 [bacterium]|nr:30S ribosomal protein S21 [bacterium]